MSRKSKRKARRLAKRKYEKRANQMRKLTIRRMSKHHLTPESRGGKATPENILFLDWDRHHTYWHKLFGNMTLEEIIDALQRIARMKHRIPVGTPDGTCQ